MNHVHKLLSPNIALFMKFYKVLLKINLQTEIRFFFSYPDPSVYGYSTQSMLLYVQDVTTLRKEAHKAFSPAKKECPPPTKSAPAVVIDPLGAGMVAAMAQAKMQPLKCCYKSCGKTAAQTKEKVLLKEKNHAGKRRYCTNHAAENPCSTFVEAHD
jgi:hypothetical protein